MDTEPAPQPTPTRSELKAQAAQRKAALRGLLRPIAGATRAATVLQLIASAATLVPFIAIAELAKATTGVQSPAPGHIWVIVAVAVGGFLVRLVAGSAALAVTHFADVRLGAELREQIVRVLGRVPLGWFSRNSSGSLRKAVSGDIGDLHYLVAHATVATVGAVAVPLFGLGYLVVLDWRLALLALATVPIYLATYLTAMRGAMAKVAERNEVTARVSAAVVEFVSGIAVVRTFGRAGRAHARYAKATGDFAQIFHRMVGPMIRTDALVSITISAPVMLLTGLAGGSAMSVAGWVSPVDAITAALVAMIIPTVVLALGYGTEARVSAAAAASRITELLNTELLPEPTDPQVPADNTLEFVDVTFGYDGNPVVQQVNLRLAPGTVTALTGPSGSGKSTLAMLAARFHDPDGGSVRLGGVDLRDIAAEELYRRVGFVLQDAQLLDATLAENIALGRPDAARDAIRGAARAAEIDDDIMALPSGYDTPLGATNLSGGQAQRVAIARALLADAPVLLLDEATAFADPESEARIQAALSRLAQGRTVLVIAHRESSIRGADQIVRLERGRVVDVAVAQGVSA